MFLNFGMATVNDHASVIYGTHFPNRLFVGCLPALATATNVADFFSKYGTVLEAKVFLDQDGSSKHFGFVNFVSADDVCTVLQNAPIIFMEKKINVGPAVKKQDEKHQGKTLRISDRLFVGSLHHKVTANDLAEHFGQYGKVLEAKVVLDEHGNSRRYGFVYFGSEEPKNKILTANKPIYLKGKKINVGNAVKKEKTFAANTKTATDHQPQESQYNSDFRQVYPTNGYLNCTIPSSPTILIPVQQALHLQVQPSLYPLQSYNPYYAILCEPCCHQVSYLPSQHTIEAGPQQFTENLTVAEALDMVLNSGKKTTPKNNHVKYDPSSAEIKDEYELMQEKEGRPDPNNSTLQKRLSKKHSRVEELELTTERSN